MMLHDGADVANELLRIQLMGEDCQVESRSTQIGHLRSAQHVGTNPNGVPNGVNAWSHVFKAGASEDERDHGGIT